MLISLIKNSLKQYAMYPIYFIGEVIGSIVFPIIINSFFIASMISSNNIQSYDNSSIIFYIIVSNLIYVVTSVNVTSDIAKDIKGNGLGIKILYPVSYLFLVICKAISSIVVRIICVYFPICLLVIPFFGNSGIVNNGVISTVFLIYSCTINVLISMIIGLLAFYFTEIWGIKSVFTFLSYVLSGALFPFDLLNEEFQRLLLLTPFPYMSYVPTKLITESNYSIDTFMMFVPLVYIVFFLIAIKCIWNSGLQRYQSCGV